ncbi:uncharacterized protein LOC116337032 [Contarinia nasturtii]|uniref:uncharacterized protein LOC116337032 n=1 Tax=Contarinia nasturtii TaxID=265458 RepID=UPI0012D3E4AE|nr:uncharacterized protein LOC116337032 [Contarinia nasturtii]
MEVLYFWLKTIVTIVIISIVSSQSIKQPNDHSSTTHLNIEKINQNFVSRTKQNSSNAIRDINTNSESKTKPNPDSDDSNASNEANKAHSRKKRLIWITDDGRLALPPGTVLSLTPTISLPLVRYPLDGFLSNMTMSFPLTIDFDKLGLTDNENPLGVLPPIFARKMGRAAGSALADYVGAYLTSRKARSISEQEGDEFMTISPKKAPTLPDQHKHAFHGGERAILYGIAEDFLSTFGVDGKACLLRTICEIHSKKTLDHLGFLGEVAKLFFTATKSNYAHLLTEYVTAQQIGEGTVGPGECFPYYKKCPKSIFKSGREANKYSHIPSDSASELDDNENEIELFNDSDNELAQMNENKDATQSMFNM